MSLPTERIAQFPAAQAGGRTSARLLRARKSEGRLSVTDSFVHRLPSLLGPGDLLVLNNSRVLPTRFFFPHKSREMEVLLVREGRDDVWEAFARPMRRASEGESFSLSQSLRAEVLGRTEDGMRLLLKLGTIGAGESSIRELVRSEGLIPIPGYIRNGRAEEFDKEFYQTVFAKEEGSIAAPTAGLHFTPGLLEELASVGVSHVEITLHVGPASFVPVQDPASHSAPVEQYLVSGASFEAIRKTKQNGGRVIAVGTTCARTLESFARLQDAAVNTFHETSLFIRPGFEFQLVDALMTNFHQPQTTHLLLVAALMGENEIQEIYEHALRGEYRFLSYGDSMLLEPK